MGISCHWKDIKIIIGALIYYYKRSVKNTFLTDWICSQTASLSYIMIASLERGDTSTTILKMLKTLIEKKRSDFLHINFWSCQAKNKTKFNKWDPTYVLQIFICSYHMLIALKKEGLSQMLKFSCDFIVVTRQLESLVFEQNIIKEIVAPWKY